MEVDLLYAIPFDYSVFFAPELLGTTRAVLVGSRQGRLEVPRDRDPAGNLALMPPPSAPNALGKHLPDGWGLHDEDQAWVDVSAVLIVVPVRAELKFELSGNQIGGEGVQETLEEVRDWFEAFVHWLWTLTAQSLDPVNPDPKVLHRKSNNIIFAARTADQSSLSAAGSPGLTITMDTNGPWSERVVDERVLRLAA